MSINVYYENGVLVSLAINEKEYFLENEENIVIPISELKEESIDELPIGITLEICDTYTDDMIMLHNVPTHICQISKGKFLASFDETITRKYWDAPVGLKLWMETKRDIISERESELHDVKVENYDDDGAYISLNYSGIIKAQSFAELFLFLDTLYGEIEGATDIALGSPFERIENCKHESDFTIKVLLPLLRKLGFSNVKYNHGNKEYGKDITFARRTEFDDYEFYGVQVKFGDVSGGATGEINGLISQVNDAFSMPFYDIYTRNQVRVSKVAIVISGKFTNNAMEKIVSGITDYPMKNNTIFIDGDKINTLIERYRRH